MEWPGLDRVGGVAGEGEAMRGPILWGTSLDEDDDK